MKKYCRLLLFFVFVVILPVKGFGITYEQYMYGDRGYTFPKNNSNNENSDSVGNNSNPPEERKNESSNSTSEVKAEEQSGDKSSGSDEGMTNSGNGSENDNKRDENYVKSEPEVTGNNDNDTYAINQHSGRDIIVQPETNDSNRNENQEKEEQRKREEAAVLESQRQREEERAREEQREREARAKEEHRLQEEQRLKEEQRLLEEQRLKEEQRLREEQERIRLEKIEREKERLSGIIDGLEESFLNATKEETFLLSRKNGCTERLKNLRKIEELAPNNISNQIRKEIEKVEKLEQESVLKLELAEDKRKNAAKALENNLYDLAELYVDSQISGDPVNIITGNYVYTNCDFIAQDYGNKFYINRVYSTDNGWGSFGNNWFCPLDSRIIRCYESVEYTDLEFFTQIYEVCQRILAGIDEYEEFSGDKTKYEIKRNEYVVISDICVESISTIQKEIELNKEAEVHNKNVAYGLYKDFNSYEGSRSKIIFVDKNGYSFTCIERNQCDWVPCEKSLSNQFVIKGFKNNGQLCTDKNYPDYYLVEYLDGNQVCYSEYGTLLWEVDRNGNKTAYGYDENKISQVTTKTGEVIKIVRNAEGFISRISSPVSGDCDFTYSNSNLVSVSTNEGHVLLYEYDTDNNLVSINDSGIKETRIYYEYYSGYDKKMVSQVKNSEGNSEFFYYNYGDKKAVHETVAKDSEYYEFDENWRTKRFKTGGGDVVEYEYNSLGLISSIKKRTEQMDFSYDNRNKLKQIDFNDGSFELYDYNSSGFITKIIDRDGSENLYTYDSKGNIICEVESGVGIKNYTYFDNGLVKSLDDGKFITRYEYNQFGNPTLIERKTDDGENFIQKLDYDSKNRLIAITDDINSVTKISYGNEYILEKSGDIFERQLKYDSRKQLVELIETDLLLNKKIITEYKYTVLGKVQSVYKNKELYQLIDYYPNGFIKQFSQFELSGSNNSSGDVPKTVSGYDSSVRKGAYEKYVYGNNYRIAKIEAGECSIKGNYENSIRCVKTEGVAISYENTGTGLRQFIRFNELEPFVYEYDETGHLIEKKQPDGNYEKRVYSKAGRLLKIYGSNKRTVLFDYGKNGITVSEIDDCGKQSRYLYSLDGKLLEERLGSGKIIKYSYDAFGNPLIVDYGNKKCVYKYDLKNGYSGFQIMDSNNKVLYKESLSDNKKTHKAVIKTGDKYKTELYYDAWNNIVKKVSSEGVKHFEYDGTGKYFTGQNNIEQSKEFLWDENGHIAGMNGLSFSFGMPDSNENTSFVLMKNQAGYEYKWWFDSEKNIVKERNYSGDEKSYTYDENGLLSSVVLFDGKKIKYTNEVIGSDIVRKIFYEDGQAESLKSDLLGNVNFIGNKDGQYEYKYDTGGKLIEQKDLFSDITVIYNYDEFGRCIEKSCEYFDFIYEYSENNGLCSQIRERKSGFWIQIDYDDRNLEKLVTFSNGIKQIKDYDSEGRVILKETISPYGIVGEGQYITYDSLGRISKVKDQNENERRFYYNSDGTVCRCEYPWNDDFFKNAKKEAEECGNSEINEQEIKNNNSYWIEEYEYTPTGNIKSVKNILGIINYRYDSSGRLIQKYAGNNNASGIKYEWSKNGYLLGSYSAKEKVEFVYDNSSRPSQIICSNLETGEVTVSEYAYDVFGRRILESINGSETRRFFYDGFSTEMIMSLPIYSNYTTVGIYQNEYSDIVSSEYNWRTVDNKDYEAWDEIRYLKNQETTVAKWNKISSEMRPFVNVFVNGRNVGNIIYDGTIAEGNTYEVFSNDALGIAVSSVFDRYGSFENRLCYDVWGQKISENSLNNYDGTKSAFSNSNSVLTGRKILYDLGYRDYSPEMKCFISEDPQRFGENWYAYCAGDSVNYFDYSGLFKLKMTEYEKLMYKAGVMKCAQFSLTDAKLNGESSGISNSFDCADVSFMVDNIAAKTAGLKDYSDLATNFEDAENISGKKVAVQSVNFFTGDTDSSVRKLTEVDVSKTERSKGLDTITPGTVLVWKNPKNPDLDPNAGWLGHTMTIVSVEYNENGVPTGAAYIEGHTGGGKTEIGYMTLDKHALKETNYKTEDEAIHKTAIFDVSSWIGEFAGAFEIERTPNLVNSCP